MSLWERDFGSATMRWWGLVLLRVSILPPPSVTVDMLIRWLNLRMLTTATQVEKQRFQPSRVWFSGVGITLQTEMSLVQLLSQGTCLDCGPGPQLGVCERQLINVSLIH